MKTRAHFFLLTFAFCLAFLLIKEESKSLVAAKHAQEIEYIKRVADASTEYKNSLEEMRREREMDVGIMEEQNRLSKELKEENVALKEEKKKTQKYYESKMSAFHALREDVDAAQRVASAALSHAVKQLPQ
jgi:hypothetical protein